MLTCTLNTVIISMKTSNAWASNKYVHMHHRGCNGLVYLLSCCICNLSAYATDTMKQVTHIFSHSTYMISSSLFQHHQPHNIWPLHAHSMASTLRFWCSAASLFSMHHGWICSSHEYWLLNNISEHSLQMKVGHSVFGFTWHQACPRAQNKWIRSW